VKARTAPRRSRVNRPRHVDAACCGVGRGWARSSCSDRGAVMLPKAYSAAAKKIDALQAEIDELITLWIRERAAEISGVPALLLRRMLERRSCGYCCGRALKTIANETDVLGRRHDYHPDTPPIGGGDDVPAERPIRVMMFGGQFVSTDDKETLGLSASGPDAL